MQEIGDLPACWDLGKSGGDVGTIFQMVKQIIRVGNNVIDSEEFLGVKGV